MGVWSSTVWYNVRAHCRGTSPDPEQSSKGSWRKDSHGRQEKGCKHQAPALPTAWNTVPRFLLGSQLWHPGLCREPLPDHPLKLEFPGALCPLSSCLQSIYHRLTCASHASFVCFFCLGNGRILNLPGLRLYLFC